MLESDWEKYATDLANAMTAEEVAKVYNAIASKHKINLSAPAVVYVARDTRASGLRLVEALTEALKATNTEVTNHKYATTPQLHYYTRCTNTKGTQDDYGEPSEQGYYEKYAAAWKQVMEHVKPQGTLTVDCANGVGGPKLKEFLKYLPSAEEGGVDIKIVNDDIVKPESLNANVSYALQTPPASPN